MAAEVGMDAEGLCVCHKCDNPSCVRPSHLFVGTTADNLRDMREKDRHQRGERHALARLSRSDVTRMIARRKRGDRYVDIARDFGVKPKTVSRICKGQRWRHIDRSSIMPARSDARPH